MSTTINITDVPRSTKKPGAYGTINTRGAKSGLPVAAQKILLVGTRGSAAAVTTTTPVQVFSADEVATYYGTGTPLHLMGAALFEENPNLSDVWVVGLAEAGGGVAATGTIVVSIGTLTAGSLTIQIGSKDFTIAIAASDTANAIASAISAAIGLEKDLPVTASVSTATVTLTTKVKGEFGNGLPIASSFTGSGLTLTVTAMASGATDPDTTAAWTEATPTQYDIIVLGYNNTTAIGLLKAHLDTVSGAMEQRPGVGIAGFVGTLSTATTLTAGVNHGRVMMPYLRGTQSHAVELAAAIAGELAAEEDLARPLNGLTLSSILVPAKTSDFLSRTEQESCLSNGAACLQVVNGEVQIVRSVTTYVKDSYGSLDDTLIDIQTIRVLDYVRYAVRIAYQQKLGRVKIANTAVTPNTTDPTLIRSLILGVLKQLEADLGYVENVDDHADRLVVERDSLVATRVNAQIPADIVDGLHVFAYSVDLILG